MNFFYTRQLLLLLVSLITLNGCLPETEKTVSITHSNVGGEDLYIPNEYLKFGHTSIGQKGVLLQTWYPGGAPAPGDDSTKLWAEGVWWKNVRILMSVRHDKTISPDQGAKASTKYLKATTLVGEEYGLQHYTQPEDGNQDMYDVWFEKANNEILSRITCTEQLTEQSKPNCTHYFFWNNFSAKVSYDRRFLPEWKKIKTNAVGLLNSFKSEQSAKKHLLKQFELQPATSQEVK